MALELEIDESLPDGQVILENRENPVKGNSLIQSVTVNRAAKMTMNQDSLRLEKFEPMVNITLRLSIDDLIKLVQAGGVMMKLLKSSQVLAKSSEDTGFEEVAKLLLHIGMKATE